MNGQLRHPVWHSGTAHGAVSWSNTGRWEYQVESCDSVYQTATGSNESGSVTGSEEYQVE